MRVLQPFWGDGRSRGGQDMMAARSAVVYKVPLEPAWLPELRETGRATRVRRKLAQQHPFAVPAPHMRPKGVQI